MVRSFHELKKQWDDHVSFTHYHPGIVIKDTGLVLGADTILVRMGETSSGAKALAVEADRERLLTLLGVSYGHRVPPGIVKNIEKAAEHWRRGDQVLAHIHLAFTACRSSKAHMTSTACIWPKRSSTTAFRRAKCSRNLAST